MPSCVLTKTKYDRKKGLLVCMGGDLLVEQLNDNCNI